MVIIKKYEKFISILLLMFIILPTFFMSGAVYADNKIYNKAYDSGNTIDRAVITAGLKTEMIADFNTWINQIEGVCGNKPIINLSYKNDDVIYKSNYFKMTLPSDTTGKGRIVYTYSTYGSIDFKYQILNSDGSTTEYPVTLNLYAYDENTKTTTSLLTSNSANNYTTTNDKDFNGYMMSVLSNYNTYKGQEIKISVSAKCGEEVVSTEKTIITDFDPTVTGNVQMLDKTSKGDEFSLFALIKDVSNFVFKNFIEPLLNGLFLSLGDGVVSLVSSAVGER